MKQAIIDFETYYDNDISVVNLGTDNYAAKADAYIVGVLVDGDAQCGTLSEMHNFCVSLARDPSVQPVAANSNFDQAFWEKYFPAFKQPWHCLLDHAAFHQYPRNLAMLAGVTLGQRVDKTKRDEMKGVRYEELPAADRDGIQMYCQNDCIQEYRCLETLPPMSPLEEKVAAHTRLVNRRGVQINVDLVEADKTRLEQMRFDAFKAIPWHSDAPPLSYQQLVKYCGTRNITVPASLAKTDEHCADLMEASPELAEIVGMMRRYRRANTMICKISTLMDRVNTDGILPLDILYCGAPHTRRWSSKGFNIQNLDKEPLVTYSAWEAGKVPADAPASSHQTVWTRNWIVPRPGHKFLILDYSQIEPRVLNWLAGNEAMLSALRAGYSIYESFAIQAEGWKGKPGTIKEELGKKRYTLLKNRVLGLGYGMGAKKFEDYVRVNGGEVSTSEAKAIVASFRAGNQKTVQLWNRLDNLIVTASRDKSRELGMQVPSGDWLKYFAIQSKSGGYMGYVTKGDFGHQSMQPRLWGGTLTENVTQRVARDVLASAIVRLEEAGLRVAFHVHDEVILEVPEDSQADARAEAEKIMTTPPEWASDLPLGVEGDWADAYTK